MNGRGRKRPWLAALLAFAYPGLGHVYLREWARALLWFGVALMSASLLVPEAAVPSTLSVSSLEAMVQTLPLTTTVAFGLVTGLSVVDAYWLARTANERRERPVAGDRCPNCGRDLDSDLEFCHWCTAELDEPGENRDSPA